MTTAPSLLRLCRGIGDALAQRIEGHGFQRRRCAIISAYGGAFNGIVGHSWYQYLDTAVRGAGLAPGTARFVATKVLADTVIFGPIHVAAFFTVITLAEGGTWGDVKAKLERDMLPALAAEVAVWPGIQAVNFWKVPLDYQLLVVNGFTVLDATFISYVQHQDFLRKVQDFLGVKPAETQRTK